MLPATSIFSWLAVGLAELAPQAGGESDEQVALDGGMRGRAAGPFDRLEPVELVAQFLAFLPGEEGLDAQRLAKRDVHGFRHSTTRRPANACTTPPVA